MVWAVKIEGVEETAAAFMAAGAYAQQAQLELAHEYGARLAAAVRGRATGRPGPNVITGRYIASVDYRIMSSPGGAEAFVYSEAPQAARLEHGFYNMRDSLGRLFFQEPLPHFQPALDEQGPHYVAAQHALAARVTAMANRGAPAGGGGRGGLLRRAFGRVFGR
jgi:hypothetical protein